MSGARLAIPWPRPICPLLVLVLLASSCSEGSSSSVDAASDSPAGDADSGDEGLAEADVDAATDIPSCPDVTPTHEILTLDRITEVRIIIRPPDQEIALNLCRWTPALPWAEKLAEVGPCRLLHEILPSTETPENLDSGDVTIEVNGIPTLFEGEATGMPCYRLPVAVLPALAEGDTVRVWSTGGTDVPAFDLTAIVPPRPVVAEPAEGDDYARCAPWRVGWTPAPPPIGRFSVVGQLDDRQFYVFCRDLSDSAQAVPAAITALWSPAVGRAEVHVATEVTTTSTGAPAVALTITSYAGAAGPRVDIVDPAP